MKEVRSYKYMKVWFFVLITSSILLSWQTGLAKDEDIPPEIIYYDYVDVHS